MSVNFVKTNVRSTISILVIGLIMLSQTVSGASPPKSKHMSALNASSAQNVSDLLTNQIRRFLESRGAKAQYLRSVRLVTERSIVRIDLSKDYLPEGMTYIGSELEDKISALSNTALGTIENELGYKVSEI